jgi:hypothetical protein
MLLLTSVFSTHKRVTPVCFAIQRPHHGVPLPSCRGGFVDISEDSDGRASERINAAKAHVLVDLNGWTAGHRAAVIAARPCAVQVCVCMYACVHVNICSSMCIELLSLLLGLVLCRCVHVCVCECRYVCMYTAGAHVFGRFEWLELLGCKYIHTYIHMYIYNHRHTQH